jgi:excisionase family DNA binding protein
MNSIIANSAVVGERMNNREAADYLGLKAATLNKWRCHGAGPPFIKVGRLVRYRRADLDDFLKGRLRRSTADNGFVFPPSLLQR